MLSSLGREQILPFQADYGRWRYDCKSKNAEASGAAREWADIRRSGGSRTELHKSSHLESCEIPSGRGIYHRSGTKQRLCAPGWQPFIGRRNTALPRSSGCTCKNIQGTGFHKPCSQGGCIFRRSRSWRTDTGAQTEKRKGPQRQKFLFPWKCRTLYEYRSKTGPDSEGRTPDHYGGGNCSVPCSEENLRDWSGD